VILNFEEPGEVDYGYDVGLMSFVPSVTYKDGPAIDAANLDGEDVEECVVVTSIKQAEEKTTDLSQEDRDFLLEIYEQLEDGTMVLPLKGAYVIRDLVDVSFAHNYCCQDEKHGNKAENLAEEGVKLSVTFDLDVDPNENVFVMTYIDEEWVLVGEVENNGDGTITCQFEDICPVVFAVADKEKAPWNPSTGDAAGNHLMMVMGVMLLSAAGVVTLVGTKARKIR
jgi:LPXTG-motif cell wall-anchored protein